MKVLLYILLSISCCACIHTKRLEYALEFAGENRSELEKVLTHYKDSGRKYHAACVRIENMPRYYAYAGSDLDSLKAVFWTTEREKTGNTG